MLHIVRSSLHSDFDCAQDDTSAVGRSAEKHRAKRRWNLGRAYDAFAIGICAAFSMFSINIPYPVVGSLIKTCVTAPTSLPFWIIGEPDRSVVNKGQHFLTKNSQNAAESNQTVTLGGNVIQVDF